MSQTAGPDTQIKIKFNGKAQQGYYTDVSNEIKRGIHFLSNASGATHSWYVARKSSRGNVFDPIVALVDKADGHSSVPEIEVSSVKDVENALKSIR